MSAVEIYKEPPPTVSAVTPLEMLNRAVETGAAVETIEKLMALYERWDAAQARKAYDEAIAEAKAAIPPIVKDKKVDFTTQKGRTNYSYEGFDTVARIVDPILSQHGLSYRFRSSQEGQKLRVTCILSHRAGYSEETTLEAHEDHSGNKNSIQAIGSSATYLQRYTLKLALGLSTAADDDGKAAGAGSTITDEQREQLQAKIAHVGADLPRFLQHFKIERMEELPADAFRNAMALLNAKEKGPQNGR